MDAVTNSSCDWTRKERVNDCSILRATLAAESLSATSLSRMVNSSPPRREIVSEARVQVAERTRPLRLVLGVAGQAQRRRAGVAEVEIAVEQHHAAPAFLDQCAEALLALFQLELRALALGDVADERGEGLLRAAA